MSLPSGSVLLKAAEFSINEDKPIFFDYYRDSLEKKCCIGVQDKIKYLVKSSDEYTSTIQQVFKCENCFIVMTENSLYIVDAGISVKRVLPPTEEKTQ
jgi:hypothetical protein